MILCAHISTSLIFNPQCVWLHTVCLLCDNRQTAEASGKNNICLVVSSVCVYRHIVICLNRHSYNYMHIISELIIGIAAEYPAIQLSRIKFLYQTTWQKCMGQLLIFHVSVVDFLKKILLEVLFGGRTHTYTLFSDTCCI